ncbi:MAG: hypothetical protein RIT28_4708 [Pseudomonadota bacterium]
MAVRVGKVELRAVQSLRSEEARALIEQRAPGQAGAVFQDLGRGPTTLHVEGLLLGDAALDAMEVLRGAQAKAEPLSFAADIATGTEITEVLVEDFRCTQSSGAVNRYQFTLRLREYVEPPSPIDAGVPAVDAGVLEDAGAWAALAGDVAANLQNPAGLAGALLKNPGLLDALDMGDLAASIVGKLEEITGADLSGLLKVIKSIDPQKVIDLIQAIQDADSLGDFLMKYAEEGLDLLEDLTGVDLGAIEALVTVFSQGTDILARFQRVQKAAEALVKDLGDFDPLAGLPVGGGA